VEAVAKPLRWDKGHGWHRLDADGHTFHIDEYSDGSVKLTIDEGTSTEERLGRYASLRLAKATVRNRLAGGGWTRTRKPCPLCGKEAAIRADGGVYMHHDPRRAPGDPRGQRCFGPVGPLTVPLLTDIGDEYFPLTECLWVHQAPCGCFVGANTAQVSGSDEQPLTTEAKAWEWYADNAGDSASALQAKGHRLKLVHRSQWADQIGELTPPGKCPHKDGA
jgi:hypothetical protein